MSGMRCIPEEGWRAEPGQQFDHCVMLGVPFVLKHLRYGNQWAVFECECGEVFVSAVYRVVTGDIKSCGCRKWKNGLLVPKGRWIVKPGEVFGGLKVIGEAFWLPTANQHHQYVMCECACGKVTVKRSTRLKRGDISYCSPGCGISCATDHTVCAEIRRTKTRQYAKRYRELAKNKEAARRHRRTSIRARAGQMCCSSRGRAKRLGIPFDLTIDFIEGLLRTGVCSVTGVDFEYCLDGRSPWVPSLDRINPADGYVRENVRVVAWIYNAAKWSFSDDDVLAMAKALVKIRSEK